MRHLRSFLDVVERAPDRPFLVDVQGGRTFSYGEMHAAAGAAAAELRRRRARRGDRIAISLRNSAELAALYLGALQAGVVAVPLGSGFGRRELRSVLSRSAPALVLCDDDRVGNVAHELGHEPLPGLDPFTAAPPAEDWEPFDGVSSADVVAIHFTSGTTGVPRGVAHRLRDFSGNARRYAEAAGLDESRRIYATLPMTYMAGYYNLLLLPWTIGASIVLDKAFDASSVLRYWRAPMEHGADTLWLVPTIMAMLLEVDRDQAAPDWCAQNVRLAVCGTAPLDPELRERFEERYGVAVHDSYGLSESLLATASTPAAPAPPGTVGTPLPGVEVEVRAGGEIFLRSPDMLAGYVEDAAAGRLALPLDADGWLPTGDTGTVAEDGSLAITGRSKEIVIRGGVNVSPTEVERVLRAQEAVDSVAVVGIPHRVLGEDLAAVVVLRDGLDLEEVEPALKSAAREGLEAPQQPGVYVQIDELPATPTGKVRKGALRDLVIDRLGLPPRTKGFTPDPADGVVAAPGRPAPGGRVVDLTHDIREGMTTFPGPNHPRVEVTVLARHHLEGRATRRLVLGTHTGTHVDAPLHFLPDGGSVDQLSLESLVGPAHVVDLSDAEPLEAVDVERLRAALGGRPQHPRVLLRYGWSHRFDTESYYVDWPHLAEEVCPWLVEHGVRLLGMDTPSPDDPRLGFGSERDSPNHHVLLGAGVILLEYLANLDQLQSPDVFLVALPLRVAGADGAPARVIALER